MNIADLRNVMTALARSRPVFHSEADFQHALGWQIHLDDRTTQIRLERRFPAGQYIDLTFVWQNLRVGMELKYPTRDLSFSWRGEPYKLLRHYAVDVRRWDVVHDLVRIEDLTLSEAPFLDVGFVVVLTNDQAYWNVPGHRESIDAAFRLHQGAGLAGVLAWGEKAGKGTIRNREEALKLTGDYLAEWVDYSDVASVPGGRFRYLAMEVRQPTSR